MDQIKLSKNICDLKPFSNGKLHGILAFSYHLDKPTGIKTGAVYILKIEDGGIQLISKSDTEYGILMGTIIKVEKNNIFVVLSCHDSAIRLCTINMDDGTITCEKMHKFSGVCLYHSVIGNNIYATFSDGSIACICDMKCTSKIAHDYEVWSICKMPSIIVSGSDDCKIRLWDNDLNMTGEYKKFESGVTYIQSVDDNTFVNSTFNGDIYLFDIRAMSKPVESIHISEQVWNWVSLGKLYIFSCIYSGYLLYQGDEQLKTLANLKLVDCYKKHTTISYAATFSQSTAVTSGYYDSDIHIVNQWNKYIN